MLSNSNVIAFVPTINAARARAFYEGTLGLRVVSDDAFALVLDANGTMLRVQKVKELTPAGYTVLGWDVADIAAIAKTLSDKGVSCERYPWFEQDDLGVWKAPGGALVAWFKDPYGNVLSITQH